MTEKQPNRLIIKEMIEAGGATKKGIQTELGITSASLATNFTYLRLMGHYPVADENGVLSFVDAVEWEKIQTDKKANARKATTKKTPEERLVAAEKRVVRSTSQKEAAEKRLSAFEGEADSDEGKLLNLRSQRADIESQIADIEFEGLKVEFSDEWEALQNSVVEEEEEEEELEASDPADDGHDDDLV